jgi:hypothetical protein
VLTFLNAEDLVEYSASAESVRSSVVLSILESVLLVSVEVDVEDEVVLVLLEESVLDELLVP